MLPCFLQQKRKAGASRKSSRVTTMAAVLSYAAARGERNTQLCTEGKLRRGEIRQRQVDYKNEISICSRLKQL